MPLDSDVMPHRGARLIASTALVLVLAAAAQAMLDLPYQPRLDSPAANYWAAAVLAALVPLLAFAVARTFPASPVRRAACIGAALLVLPCALISSCAVFEAPPRSSMDASYELLSEARAGRAAYRLYRTNCGATCAYGLELREELDLSFGVKLVSPRWSLYRASDGALRVEPSSVLVVRGEDVLGRVAR